MNLYDDLEKQARLNPRGRGIDENALQHFNFNTRLTNTSYVGKTGSGQPEAMMKVISFARGARVRKMMEYIARTGKEGELALEDENGVKLENRDDIAAVHGDWSEDFERAKPGQTQAQKDHEKKVAEWVDGGRKGKKPRTPKGPARHATHIILSASSSNDAKASRQVEDAARTVLREKFGQAGYEYVFTVHRDTENPHVHVVVKNYNRELDKKLRLDKKDLFAVRQHFAKELEKRGIKQIATLRRDRPQTIEKIAEGVESVRQRATWFKSKIKASQSPLVNVDSALQQQTRKIHMIEKQLEKSVVPGRERLKIKTELRQLKQTLIAAVGENPEKAVAATVKTLGRDAKVIETGLKEIAKTKELARTKPLARSEARAIKKNLTAFAERYAKELKSAVTFIEKQKIPAKEKKAALKQLKQHRRVVTKAFGLSIER